MKPQKVPISILSKYMYMYMETRVMGALEHTCTCTCTCTCVLCGLDTMYKIVHVNGMKECVENCLE